MPMSTVSFVNTSPNQKDLLPAVRRAMELIGWEKYIKDGRILIKINAVSGFLIPGANTSPLVLDAVLNILRENFSSSELIVVDTDSAARSQFDKACELWGYTKVAARYGATIVNLLHQHWVEVPVDGLFLKKLFMPEKVLDADTIISVPVIKTHTWSMMSCSLKNQLGFTPKNRHLFHPYLDQVIPDINLACRVHLAVVDGTIGLEAGGPVMGRPKVCNVILSGNDLVAVDSVVCRYMGIDPKEIAYIRLSEKMGIGSTQNVKLVGDEFQINCFVPAIQNLNSVWHKRLRMSPFGDILFRSFAFRLMSYASTTYQIYWFYKNRDRFINEQHFPATYREAVSWNQNIYIPLL